MVTGYWLGRNLIPDVLKYFHFSTSLRRALGSIQPPTQRVPEVLSLGEKRQVLETKTRFFLLTLMMEVYVLPKRRRNIPQDGILIVTDVINTNLTSVSLDYGVQKHGIYARQGNIFRLSFE
jgi:hypothetical protein